MNLPTMAVFFVQIIGTVLVFLLLAAGYLGLGQFTFRLLRLPFPSDLPFFFLIWLGWAIVLLVLQVIHIVLPINAWVSIPLLGLGVLLGVRRILNLETLRRIPKGYAVVLLVAALWVADLAMKKPTIYDSGLYHLNLIRWLNESPVVLGLGNLHGRLAFNQSFFAYAAFLNFYPFLPSGSNLANCFLLLLFLAECLWDFRTAMAHPGQNSLSHVAGLFFLLLFPFVAVYYRISSPSPDLASLLLQIIIFLYFVRAWEDRGLRASLIGLIFILSATAITMKLSNLFYVAVVCILLLARNGKLRIRVALPALAVPAIILFVWMVRGLLLSGCPAYPSPFGCLQLPWSVPADAVRQEADWIASWARTPYAPPETVLHSWDWLAPWYEREIRSRPLEILYPIAVAIAVLLAGMVLQIRRHPRDSRHWPLILLPLLVGFIFWFTLAPDVRFAQAFIWILPVAALLCTLQMGETAWVLRPRVILVLLLFLYLNEFVIFAIFPQALVLTLNAGYEPRPQAALTEQFTRSGLPVWVPVTGDQCWESALVCTPAWNADLHFAPRAFLPKFYVTRREQAERP